MKQGVTNPEVNKFFGKAGRWRAEMEKLREIILHAPLTEELKWGKPTYTFQESNIVIVQGFKEYCALMFCKGALLRDVKGLLVKPGENTQAGRQLRFTSVKEIGGMEAVLRAYIKEAMGAEEAGREVVYKETADYAVPEELKKKLGESPAFRHAFEGLTPGRQRGYLLHFAAAKQSTTREARIDKCRPFILKGLGIHEHWKDRPARSTATKSKKSAEEYSDVKPSGSGRVRLLSGGNPQIAKGEGDAPVQAYIAAMPGWKSDLGKRVDAIIERTVPKVQKAVKWNSPFYGMEGRGWLVSFHVLTRYVKVTFFKGMSLKPIPPGGTERSGEARWIDIYEQDKLDEAQMAKWVKQAAALPGWKP